ncbi:FAD:protein FMN transferase [Cupriavidus sp. RAF12]|uniref:FAD:protein FMN transferase n=1 Tax=Cupriavidus sp. RAF12 TaxID=3233050 RepID=UPI003F8F5268
MIPNPVEIAREIPLVNYRDLLIDPGRGTAFLRRHGMRIDLGGIAKLPVLQAGMAALLRHHDLAGAMINGGGDVLVSGQLQGHDWRIGVRDPLAPGRLIGALALSEGVVASSGDYERAFVMAGRRYHHILDPRTGQPAAGPHGVTLVARGVEEINGLGAAIMVAGSRAGRRLLTPLRDVDALIVAGDGQTWMSDGMATRLRGLTILPASSAQRKTCDADDSSARRNVWTTCLDAGACLRWRALPGPGTGLRAGQRGG